jgi:3-oxoacyl-[acyl-carrier protein] reductase
MNLDSSRLLEGRVAIVTGGCTGIGRAIARRLGDAGAAVVVNHPHTPELAQDVLEGLHEEGVTAITFGADVTSRVEFAQMVQFTLDHFGRWDVLVSNAAIALTKPLIDFDEATIDKIFAVNVKAVIWGVQLASASMNPEGRIINIGSSTTGLMLKNYGVYDASKAAVEQLTRIGAHELGERGITVNVVAPGATATETYVANRGDEMAQRFAAMSAFGRLGDPVDIADVVTLVASERTRWVTGQVIRVNGGTV